jgi:hypothetical protein
MNNHLDRAPIKTLTRWAWLPALLLTAGLLLSACGQAGKTAAGTDPTGVYTLTSVNGDKVPASISHEGVKLQVRSGTFTINADKTCSTKTTFVPPNGAEATREVKATYTQEGSKLTMQWQGAGMTTATVEARTLTMNNEGMVLVYQK